MLFCVLPETSTSYSTTPRMVHRGSVKVDNTGVCVITEAFGPKYQFVSTPFMAPVAREYYTMRGVAFTFYPCESKDEFERDNEMKNIEWAEDFDDRYHDLMELFEDLSETSISGNIANEGQSFFIEDPFS